MDTGVNNPGSNRPQITLSLSDASEEPVALAVLSAMYAVKPIPELLAQLSQEQQLQAALLADLWQVSVVSTAAVQALIQAHQSEAGLANTVVHTILGWQVHPACLQPLVKMVLLSVLGDLEAAWSDPALQDLLMGLPLTSMELLLSCDELQVAGEDSVLYTAVTYIERITDKQQQQAATSQLAPLIRCQHLSTYWLSAAVLSDEAPNQLLCGFSQNLKQLLLQKLTSHTPIPDQSEYGQDWYNQYLKPQVPADAPASWRLQPRALKEVDQVQLTWQVDIGTLRETALRAVAGQEALKLFSYCVSPPLGGFCWNMSLICIPGAPIGLYVQPSNLVANTWCSYSCSLSVPGTNLQKSTTSPFAGPGGDWGFQNFFGDAGHMLGGWHDPVWAGGGLPTSGKMQIVLTVTAVEHRP